MQAIILAAGTGSRLGKLTKKNTKCMLEINGSTLISLALEKLNNAGITKLILVVGYKKNNLIQHVGTQFKNISIEYIDNPIYDKTNNIYSLFLAKEKLAESDTLLLESDLIFDENIIHKVLKDTRGSLAVVDKYLSWMDGTSVELDEDDNIVSFIPKKSFRFQKINHYYKTVNIYKFSKEFSRKSYIPFLEAYSKTMGDGEYYEDVLRVINMLENKGVKALRLDGEKWYEIDDIQDKANAEVIFAPTPQEKLQKIQSRYGGYWRFQSLKDFCYLVNPYFPPQKMQEEMKAYFYDLLSQYPSGLDTQNLLAGKMFGIDSDNIIVGNGASEIIRAIGKVLEGDFGMMLPTFNEYPESLGYERVIQSIPADEAFSYTINDLKELSKKTSHLIIINPDNPSGHFIPKVELLKLIDTMKHQNKKIIIDESFVDFANNGENETLITQDILDKYPNLIVIKSISKSYGVPGIRLGVLASSDTGLIESFRQEITIWNINSFGEFFLQIIGKYKANYKDACIQIREERERFYKQLCKIDFLEIYPSSANYFLCQIKNGINLSATQLAERLLNEGVYIKDLTGKIAFDGKEYIRIAVRDYADNEALLAIFKNIEHSG